MTRDLNSTARSVRWWHPSGRNALVISLCGLVILGLCGPAYRSGLSLLTAFLLFRDAAFIGAVGVGVGLVALARGVGDRTSATIGIVLGGLVFSIPYYWQRTASSVPPIHDVSTDTTNPPTFVAVAPRRAGASNPLAYSPDVARQQEQHYPDIQPMMLDLPLSSAFDRALETMRKAGWDIVAADKTNGRIEATDTTPWFGFKDDIVVRLTPENGRTKVDVRSASRIGGSDVGTNARRIRHYLDSLRTSPP
jgi:uncharacterized protein (DUF1499 family)